MPSVKSQGGLLSALPLTVSVRLTVLTWLLAMCWALLPAQASASNDLDSSAAGAPMIASFIVNIMHYVRWPEGPEPRLFCVTGHSLNASGLRELENLPNGWHDQVLRARPDSPHITRCSAIYMGQLDNDARQALHEKTQNLPILTFSENSPECAQGGIFCLNPAAQPIRFKINLDTAARSSLRIHPKVLQLGTGRGGQQ